MKLTADHLEQTVRQALPLLEQIAEEKASLRPAANKWSPKEILGHLIDSAANNQQKFVRCMEHNGVIFPGYAQDFWVATQAYNAASWTQLLGLWEHYNYHIAHIIRHIPEAALANTITIGGSGTFTLGFIVKDYPEHLKHHLKSIFPGAAFLSNEFKMVY